MLPSRLPSRTLLVAAAVLTAVATAGCGSVDAGAAAIVDGRRVSVSEVQTATVQINRIVNQQNGGFGERDVLSFLITEPYLVGEAAQRGVGVSANEAAALIRRLHFEDPITASTTPAPETVQIVRAILALDRLQGQAFAEGDTTLSAAEGQAAMAEVTQRIRAVDISVNPRYGDFDPTFDPASRKVFPVTAQTENWFVPAAQSPQPTPSQ
jgi:hypothetical protein